MIAIDASDSSALAICSRCGWRQLAGTSSAALAAGRRHEWEWHRPELTATEAATHRKWQSRHA